MCWFFVVWIAGSMKCVYMVNKTKPFLMRMIEKDWLIECNSSQWKGDRERELSKPFEFMYTRWQVTHRRVVCVCDNNKYDL